MALIAKRAFERGVWHAPGGPSETRLLLRGDTCGGRELPALFGNEIEPNAISAREISTRVVEWRFGRRMLAGVDWLEISLILASRRQNHFYV
ncbi:MAG: hypothetical protein Q7U53_17270 [Anaerolineaceae bacterium]|nr:hypothetical protein [Anaerolineaceae bacterium]